MGRQKARRGARKGRKRTGAGTGGRAEKTSIRTGDATGATGAETGAEASAEGDRVRVLQVDAGGTNRVEVDEARIAAEMAAAANTAPELATGEAPAAQGAPVTDPAAPPRESSWAPICPAVVTVLDTFVMPNWQLTADEKAGLGEALAPVLDDLFPGGLGSERWAPYFRLLAVCGGIVLTRYDREKGLPPLHAEEDAKEGKAGNVVHQQAA